MVSFNDYSYEALLQDLEGDLKTERFLRPSARYSPEGFREGFDFLAGLENSGLGEFYRGIFGREKGAKIYQMVGKVQGPEALEAYKANFLALAREEKHGYGLERRNNLSAIIGSNGLEEILGPAEGSSREADAKAGVDTGLGFFGANHFYSSSKTKGSRALEKTIDEVRATRQLLRENPMAYIEMNMKNIQDPYVRLTVQSLEPSILEDAYRVEHQKMVTAFGDYGSVHGLKPEKGPTKALADNIEHAWTHARLERAEIRKLQEEIMEGLGENPSEEEKAKAFEARKDNFLKISRKRKNAMYYAPEMTDKFMLLARKYLPEEPKQAA